MVSLCVGRGIFSVLFYPATFRLIFFPGKAWIFWGWKPRCLWVLVAPFMMLEVLFNFTCIHPPDLRHLTAVTISDFAQEGFGGTTEKMGCFIFFWDICTSWWKKEITKFIHADQFICRICMFFLNISFLQTMNVTATSLDFFLPSCWFWNTPRQLPTWRRFLGDSAAVTDLLIPQTFSGHQSNPSRGHVTIPKRSLQRRNCQVGFQPGAVFFHS